MTPIARRGRGRREREGHAVGAIFSGWNGARRASGTKQHPDVLHRMLAHLASVPPAGQVDTTRSLLNAQISVDTASPGQLRFTMDPLAGDAFSDVRPDHAIRAVRDLGCEPLVSRVTQLYEAERELPQNLWLGLAPADHGNIVKAYISSRKPGGSNSVSWAARTAGWLPASVSPTFSSTYERLVPFFADVEGVGLGFKGDVRIGTTVYLRAVRPWSACISEDACAFLDMFPAHAVEGLTGIFGGPPAVFGWSVECDPEGCLVDVKLEVKVDGWYSGNALADYARERGIDSAPIEALADAIARAGLCEPPAPSPAFLSLRLVRRDVRRIVAYFPLTALPDGAG